MDANGTPFHLLLGRDDWARCFEAASGLDLGTLWSDASPPLDPPALAWDPRRSDLTLQPELQLFAAGKADRPVEPEDRRGAARDRFGNWFWIAPDRQQILVRNAGDGTVHPFWPPPPAHPSTPAGHFHPLQEPPPCPTVSFAGLTITSDHYLVVGTLDPGGLLRFDLQGGGPPRRDTFPPSLLVPFDLAPRPKGGFFLLDRSQRRLWEFDRAFQCVRRNPALESPPPAPGSFGPDPAEALSIAPPRSQGIPVTPLTPDDAVTLALVDPIAVEALPDGSVLVLDRRPGESLPLIAHYRDGQRLPDPTGLGTLPEQLGASTQNTFELVAHDFLFVPTTDPGTGRLVLVGRDGNQAFAFELTWEETRLQLDPSTEFFPLRRFGGRALALGDGRPFYDSRHAWVPLVAQIRPRFAPSAEILSFVFDSGTPSCVWHRILLDAALPAEAGLSIWTRASDHAEEIPHLDWNAEPALLRRPDGSELPWTHPETSPERGTWETLLQRATGRYVQLKLRLTGNGRVTPRVHALRLYAPRFSYLRNYLPPVYREDDTSASFLDRFLANFEGQLTTLEDRIATVQRLFDARTAPPETLEWLANWFGAALDPAWDEHRRRLFLEHAMTFFAYRGTLRGLHMALRLMFDCHPGPSLFTDPSPPRGRTSRYRIVERFRQRPPLARPTDSTANRWNPSLGPVALHQRWREALGSPESSVLYPVRRPSANTETWEAFSRAQLGFAPLAAGSDLSAWQAFLEQRYIGIDLLNLAHVTTWAAFNEIPLPATLPSEGALRDDWDLFKLDVRGPDAATQEELWQGFLRRRYRNPRLLRDAYGHAIVDFNDVPLPTQLPSHPDALADWFVFEGVVLPMHSTAHRFTVLLPLTTAEMRQSSLQRRDQLNLADRLIQLEKPAHTVYDVRFFWSAFRIGTARLGDDTLLGSGSRAPDLLPPLQLGAGYLSEAFVSTQPPRDGTDRTVTGQHRIPRLARSTSIPRISL